MLCFLSLMSTGVMGMSLLWHLNPLDMHKTSGKVAAENHKSIQHYYKLFNRFLLTCKQFTITLQSFLLKKLKKLIVAVISVT